jgi:hypothetical protein
VETKTILPLSVNNVVKKEHQQITMNDFSSSSPPTEYEALNFSIKHLSSYKKPNLNEQEETIKKTTPRKPSPAKVHLNSGSKSNK